jgi:hypothetical protein
MSKTYVKTVPGGHYGVTVSRHRGLVMEHPFNSFSGGGYGRKHPAANVRRTARLITRGLLAAGYVLQDN